MIFFLLFSSQIPKIDQQILMTVKKRKLDQNPSKAKKQDYLSSMSWYKYIASSCRIV